MKYEFDLIRHRFSTNDTLQGIPDLPLSVTLQITRKCNLECIYCSEDSQIKEFIFSVIKRMVDNLIGVKRIIISGGEPTLRRDLIQILSYIRKCDIPIVAMSTNATSVNLDLAKSLRSVISYIDVTIDGTY